MPRSALPDSSSVLSSPPPSSRFPVWASCACSVVFALYQLSLWSWRHCRPQGLQKDGDTYGDDSPLIDTKTQEKQRLLSIDQLEGDEWEVSVASYFRNSLRREGGELSEIGIVVQTMCRNLSIMYLSYVLVMLPSCLLHCVLHSPYSSLFLFAVVVITVVTSMVCMANMYIAAQKCMCAYAQQTVRTGIVRPLLPLWVSELLSRHTFLETLYRCLTVGRTSFYVSRLAMLFILISEEMSSHQRQFDDTQTLQTMRACRDEQQRQNEHGAREEEEESGREEGGSGDYSSAAVITESCAEMENCDEGSGDGAISNSAPPTARNVPSSDSPPPPPKRDGAPSLPSTTTALVLESFLPSSPSSCPFDVPIASEAAELVRGFHPAALRLLTEDEPVNLIPPRWRWIYDGTNSRHKYSLCYSSSPSSPVGGSSGWPVPLSNRSPEPMERIHRVSCLPTFTSASSHFRFLINTNPPLPWLPFLSIFPPSLLLPSPRASQPPASDVPPTQPPVLPLCMDFVRGRLMRHEGVRRWSLYVHWRLFGLSCAMALFQTARTFSPSFRRLSRRLPPLWLLLWVYFAYLVYRRVPSSLHHLLASLSRNRKNQQRSLTMTPTTAALQQEQKFGEA
eukprot:GHVS01096288.1.p1 GENE.GHVS01096288.1~~GHVS01096288.1.p1  ORF type:complete len:682 (+),score=160.49 GHVS01096288.1:189-2048(+)